MKRILIVISAVLLVIAMSGAVCAAERTGFEAGIKMWFNDWTHDEPGFGSVTSDTALLIGPAIKVDLGSAFVEASYLAAGSNYRFSDPAVVGNTERQDLDLAAGYRIVPEFSLLAGYKNSHFNNNAASTESTVYGPFIGARADLPIDPYLAFYIGTNYLFTKFKQQGSAGDFREDSPGWIFELGLKFSITREFRGSFGYKYETNTGNDSDVKDSFSGLTLSGMVVF
jgi:predicted porin